MDHLDHEEITRYVNALNIIMPDLVEITFYQGEGIHHLNALDDLRKWLKANYKELVVK